MVEQRAKDITKPNAHEAQNDREEHIATGVKPLAVPHQGQGLETERREGCIAATDAYHYKMAHGRRSQPTSLRLGKGGKKTDNERTRDVHEQRPPRERLTEVARHQPGKPKPSDAAQGAPNCNPDVGHGP